MEENEEDVYIKELLLIIWKKRNFIFMFAIISIIIGGIYTFLIKNQDYTATSSIMFGRVEGYIPQEGESQLLSEIQFNSSMINNYRSFIKSNKVLQQVIDNLNLNEEILVGELKEKVKISIDGTTILISVSANDLEECKAISNEIMNVFVKESKEFYQINHTYTISEADESTIKTSVNHFIDLAIFFLGGICIAILIVLVKNRIKSTINEEYEIENKIKIPNLHTLNLNLLQDGKITDDSNQIKFLRTKLQLLEKNLNETQVYFVTSSTFVRSKEFVSVNLGKSFANINKKVLIINVDKNYKELENELDITNGYGLNDYFTEKDKNISEEKIIQNTKYENLNVVTLGTTKTVDFQINIWNDFLEKMKKQYDVIIIDGAGILECADSIFFSGIADSIILVGELGETKIQDLLLAKKELDVINGNLLGTVLTDIKNR